MLKQRRNTWTIVPTRHFPFLSLFIFTLFFFHFISQPFTCTSDREQKDLIASHPYRHQRNRKSCKKKATIFYYDFLFEDTGNPMMNTSIITLSFWLLSYSRIIIHCSILIIKEKKLRWSRTSERAFIIMHRQFQRSGVPLSPS